MRLLKGKVTGCAQWFLFGWLLTQAWFSHAVPAEGAQAALPVLRIDTRELSPQAVGSELGRLWKALFPDLERRLDRLLSERLGRRMPLPSLVPPEVALSIGNLTASERAELRGLSGSLDLVRETRLGDGLLSADELLLVQFLADFGASGIGSGFGVFASGGRALGPLVARTIVFDPERNEGIDSIPETIVVYEQGDESVVSVAIAGSLGVTTGFNRRGLFFAVLPAVAVPAVLQSASSAEPIALAVRRALQTSGGIDQAVRTLRDGRYGLNHSVLIADRDEVGVLELPLAGRGRLRTAMSRLHPAMAWEHRGRIAVVSCFALAAMPSDCDDARQHARWQHLRRLAGVDAINRDAELVDLVQIMRDSERPIGTGHGEPVRQVLAFAPDTLELVIEHLNPVQGERPREPVMQRFSSLLERSRTLHQTIRNGGG